MRCVEVEAALARAQARVGLIPGRGGRGDHACGRRADNGREALDLARLKNETETVGYPILPLVRQMAELAGEAGRYVHWGATTQDIMDTAAVLQIRAGLALIEEDLTALAATSPSSRASIATRRWRGAPTCSTRCR